MKSKTEIKAKNYWELNPEELDAKGLQKYIGDWYNYQVSTIGSWGNITSNEDVASIRADVTQLAYALLLLQSNFPFDE